jgi:hypothetical protein
VQLAPLSVDCDAKCLDPERKVDETEHRERESDSGLISADLSPIPRGNSSECLARLDSASRWAFAIAAVGIIGLVVWLTKDAVQHFDSTSRGDVKVSSDVDDD